MSDKGYPFTVWNGLPCAKHRKRMKEAIWVYLVLIDWITKEQDDEGIVLGGKPITYDMINDRLEISKPQYHRYIDSLTLYNYIKTERTRNGLIIKVTKTKKWRDNSKMSNHEQSRVIKNDNSRGSELSNMSNHKTQSYQKRDPELSYLRPRVIKNDNSPIYKDRHNKDITRHNNIYPQHTGQDNIKNYDDIRHLVTGFYDYQVQAYPKQLKEYSKKPDKLIFDSINEIDKIIRLDGYTMDDIKQTLIFAVKDEFWRPQILSLRGLRVKKKNGNTKFTNAYTSMSKGKKDVLDPVKQWLQNEKDDIYATS